MNTSLNTKEKRFVAVAAVIALIFGFTPVASAMHVMEGYLPVGFSVAWGVICIPFLIAGYMSITQTSHIIIEQNHRKSDVANIKIA